MNGCGKHIQLAGSCIAAEIVSIEIVFYRWLWLHKESIFMTQGGHLVVFM